MVRASSMEPVSARLPSDIYLWLASLEIEGAPTNSDKIRVLLSQLKRQHDGALDLATAHTWVRELMSRTRDGLVAAELEAGRHSDVLLAILDHLTALLAVTISSRITNSAEAAQLEDTLVRRAFSLTESLLRQGATQEASAFDPTVVRRHIPATLELANLLNNTSNHEG
ncbi:MAG: hypothetical protein QM709_03120 [Spongiibacteraceae bacterium]